MSLFGPGRLLNANAAVTIERYTTSQDGAGGTAYAWVTLESSVPVLFSLRGGLRDASFGTDAQRDSGTMSGVSTNLNRDDCRIKITAYADDSSYVNTYWRMANSVLQPKGIGGLLARRITITVNKVDFPAIVGA